MLNIWGIPPPSIWYYTFLLQATWAICSKNLQGYFTSTMYINNMFNSVRKSGTFKIWKPFHISEHIFLLFERLSFFLFLLLFLFFIFFLTFIQFYSEIVFYLKNVVSRTGTVWFPLLDPWLPKQYSRPTGTGLCLQFLPAHTLF